VPRDLALAGGAVGAVVISAFASGCTLGGTPARVWALNESTNDYVVQTTVGEGGNIVDSWAFPAGSKGLAPVGTGYLWVHVLDARTCAVVDSEPLGETNVVNVDVRGLVSFSSIRVPDVTMELGRTTQCAPAGTPAPPGDTTS
jgi:hypothetical protein